MAQILDGNALATTIKSEIAAAVAARVATGRSVPGLAAVLVGDNPASTFYVNAKRKDCQQVGMNSWLHRLPSSAAQSELMALVEQLNYDPAVHGILVQLPLPAHFDEAAVIRAINPLKDVDAFHPENLGLLLAGHPRYVPCTPLGVLQILSRYGIRTAGREVVVIGRSNIVGKPLAVMLMQKPNAANPYAGDATVTICHSRTQNITEVTRRADIVVAAIGQAKFLTAAMVKPGAVVVDVGINAISGVKGPVGDADYTELLPLVSAITPVPGGVGPMTRAMLLHNTLQAASAM